MRSVLRSVVVATVAAVLAVPLTLTAHSSERDADEPIASVTTSHRYVALTFDDGPDRRWTPQVLDILRRYRVRATFFVLGPSVERNRALVHRETQWHNEVGCHGWLHVDEMRYRTTQVAHAFRDCRRLVERITHKDLDLVRAPYGLLSSSEVRALSRSGMKVVDWTMSGTPLASDPALVRPDLMSLAPGSIILLHDGRANRSDVVRELPRIIRRLRAEHFQMVTLSELLRSGTPVHEQASVECDRERSYSENGFIRAPRLTRRGCRTFS